MKDLPPIEKKTQFRINVRRMCYKVYMTTVFSDAVKDFIICQCYVRFTAERRIVFRISNWYELFDSHASFPYVEVI